MGFFYFGNIIKTLLYLYDFMNELKEQLVTNDNLEKELWDLKKEVKNNIKIEKYYSFSELVKDIPKEMKKNSIYQCSLWSIILNFYSNGRVNIIKSGTSSMHNRKKTYTTIFIDNKSVDLQKQKFIREDKETDQSMKHLADLYINEVHQINPANNINITDDILRERFYELFKIKTLTYIDYSDNKKYIQNLSDFKIRKIGKVWFINSIWAKIVWRKDYINGGVAHQFWDTLYVNQVPEGNKNVVNNKKYLEEFIAESSHRINKDSNWSNIISYGISLIKNKFNQNEMYEDINSNEFYAHSISERAIKSYLMLDWSTNAENEAFEKVYKNYRDTYSKIIKFQNKYKFDYNIVKEIFMDPKKLTYDNNINNQKKIDYILDNVENKILKINAIKWWVSEHLWTFKASRLIKDAIWDNITIEDFDKRLNEDIDTIKSRVERDKKTKNKS